MPMLHDFNVYSPESFCDWYLTGAVPNQTAYMKRLNWNYIGHLCSRASFPAAMLKSLQDILIARLSSLISEFPVKLLLHSEAHSVLR